MKYVHQIIKNFNRFLVGFILASILCLVFSITFVNSAVANSTNLPNAVAQAVLQDASKRSGLPIEQLRIVAAVQRDWPDGCLGLAQPQVICTQQVVPGWQVKVVNHQQAFIYRTNHSGSIVKLGSGKLSSAFPPNIVP